MRKGFVTFVQGGLIRVKCGVMYVDNLTQANFALEGNRVKTGSLLDYLPINVVVKLLTIDIISGTIISKLSMIKPFLSTKPERLLFSILVDFPTSLH